MFIFWTLAWLTCCCHCMEDKVNPAASLILLITPYFASLIASRHSLHMLTQPWFPIVLIVLYRPRNQKKLFQPSPFGVWVVNESPIDNSFDTFKRTCGIDYSHIIQSNHRIVFWYYLYHSRCSLPTRPAPKHCVIIEDDITRLQRFIGCLAWVILIAVK